MYRFFVPVENIEEESIRITGDDVNHAKNVLRMSPGEKVVVSCGQGVDYYCIIDYIRDAEIGLCVEERRPVITELGTEITLYQALPKSDKMELVIQKAVELGAVKIVPVRTRRCIVRLDKQKAEKKLARWRSIAEAAAKQSGRGIIPEIPEIMSFAEALEDAGNLDAVLIPYELYDGMQDSFGMVERAAKSRSVGVFIGPEGGFERGEIEQAIGQGAVPISLGKRILRTETAGMTVLSILMFMIEGRKEG